MRARAFERGDIVRACLNPVSGSEMRGEMRPCIVLSTKEFNRLGLTLIAPITQGGNHSRYHGFSVSLMGSGTETQGVISVNGVRSVDLTARKAKKIESAPEDITEEALAILSAIIE